MGILVLLAPPASIVFGVVALFRDTARGYAVAGLVIGGITGTLILLPALLR